MSDKKEKKKEITPEEIKALVICRLRSMPEGMKIAIGNEDSYSISQLIEEVNDDSEVGKTIVEAQMEFLKSLKSGEILNAG